MAINDPYCAVAELKSEIGGGHQTASHDVRYEDVIAAVSRLIDEHCDRHFYATVADTVKRFTAPSPDTLWIPDVHLVASVVVDRDGDGTYEETWVADTDFFLEPEDAATYVRPWTRLEIPTGTGNQGWFPVGVRRGVKITGTWGWSVVPAQVKRACLIQSMRVFKRSESPLGIAPLAAVDGAGIRVPSKLDSDVSLLLSDLRRTPIGVV